MRKVSSWVLAGFTAALTSIPLTLSAQDSPPAKAAAAPAAPPYAPPAAAPGVFEATPVAGGGQRLVVKGKKLTDRKSVEEYLLYRAAMQTLESKSPWFTFVRKPEPGEQVAPDQEDPNGPAYAFRLDKFQPVWRYQTAGSTDWKTWSPFSNKPFLDGVAAGAVTAFEVTAEIQPKKGAFPYHNTLAFDAAPVSELLTTRVKPPV